MASKFLKKEIFFEKMISPTVLFCILRVTVETLRRTSIPSGPPAMEFFFRWDSMDTNLDLNSGKQRICFVPERQFFIGAIELILISMVLSWFSLE